jgi:hypothetical protein
VSIGAVQIEKAEGSEVCVEASAFNGIVQVEACISVTIDDDGNILFSVDFSIEVDPCPIVPCPFRPSTEINCKIDVFDASLECKR